MTITTCDCCGINIPNECHKFPESIVDTTVLPMPGEKRIRFVLKVDSYQFNTTNFALCRSCLVKAVAARVEQMVVADLAKPATPVDVGESGPNWHPIGSAPKDGSVVELLNSGGVVEEARFINDGWFKTSAGKLATPINFTPINWRQPQ